MSQYRREERVTADPRQIEDVDDVFKFAAWQVGRTFAPNGRAVEATAAQLEEARAEALLLIYQLREEWDPERCPRFSAFLLATLPRRLISWWRRELRQSGRGTWSGSRGGYVYFRTVSLDAEGEAVGVAAYDRHQ